MVQGTTPPVQIFSTWKSRQCSFAGARKLYKPPNLECDENNGKKTLQKQEKSITSVNCQMSSKRSNLKWIFLIWKAPILMSAHIPTSFPHVTTAGNFRTTVVFWPPKTQNHQKVQWKKGCKFRLSQIEMHRSWDSPRYRRKSVSFLFYVSPCWCCSCST